MNKSDLPEKILALKKAKDAVILAHNYQIPAIQDLADFVGDSLELSKISKKIEKPLVVFCGVRFMAETAKILSPHKKVILPVPRAGCPLADTISADDILKLKAKHPDAWVVSYVNTSAQIKALSDVCCTSANAVNVVKNVPSKKVIFVPDKNLGWWVQKNVPDKELIIWHGHCFVHEQFSLADLRQARIKFPDAVVLAHPECKKEVLEESDFVLSTAGMLKCVKESLATKFIIGTEEGLIHKLKKENPAKEFYSLGSAKICINMKQTNLQALYASLSDEFFQINLEQQVIEKAAKALEEMIKYI